MYDKSPLINHVLSFIDFSKPQTILDIGCGRGDFLKEIGKRSTSNSKIYGIDVSSKSIDYAISQMEADERFILDTYDIENDLKYGNNTFNTIICCNVLECINNKTQLIQEIHRVLKPNGVIIMSHFDWDTQIFNVINKDLFRKIIQTYNDWQQPWMNTCDSWMGRRLSGLFKETNLFDGTISSIIIAETEYKEGMRGYMLIQNELIALSEQGLIPTSEFEKFRKEIIQIANKGHYFYSINLYTYVGRKKDI